MPELLLTRQKDYVYDDSDNPFRPEGDLAKEADEFVQQLKQKEQQELKEMVETKTTPSKANPEAEVSATAAAVAPVSSPTKSYDNSQPKSSDDASNVVVVSTDAPKVAVEAQTPTVVSNGTPEPKLKKSKTKSKCGCSIS